MLTGTTQRISDIGVNDHLNDIDANRLVYTSDLSGNDDICMYAFNLVPAPSTLALATLGFAGLAAWGRRRRKRT